MPFDGENFVAGNPPQQIRWWRQILDFVQQPDAASAPMTLRLLLDARNMIANKSHWGQGAYEKATGNRRQRCAVGALRAAVTRQPGASNSDFNEAYASLKLSIGYRYQDVENYNDSHLHRDVMQLFDRSIARCDPSGPSRLFVPCK